MKKQRLRIKVLALFLFGLFALLAVYGGYTVLTNRDRWFASSHNARIRAQKQSVTAGSVLDRNGVVLAANDAEGNRVYAEDAAVRKALVHILGDGAGHISNGVEDFHASYLYGFRTSLGERISLLFSGGERIGDTLQLTLSAELCARLSGALRDRGVEAGAAVVLDWQTGEILAMTSLPAFDPVPDGTAVPGTAYLNRATRYPYAPGAVFGPVAAACAEAAPRPLQKAAEAFGFNDNFLFADIVVENSVYPTDLSETALEARLRGEGGIRATPLHLCMTAAAAANGGAMMTPRLIRMVYTPENRVRVNPAPTEYRTAFTPEATERVRAAFADRGDGILGIGTQTCFLGYLKDTDTPWAVCVVAEGSMDESVPAGVASEVIGWYREFTAPGRNSAARGE